MSDQADRAAEKIIAEINNCNSRECHLDKIHKTTIASLIRSTVTAPRELVEAAKTFRDLVGEKAFNPKDSVWAGHCPYCNSHWMSGHSDTCRFDKADQALRSALTAQEPKVCPEGACPSCWGTGNVMISHVNQCSTCHGAGVIKIKES